MNPRPSRPAPDPTDPKECLLTQFGSQFPGHYPGQDGPAAQTPASLGVLAAHKMARAGPLASNLAPGSNLDPLSQAPVRLLFRHLSESF